MLFGNILNNFYLNLILFMLIVIIVAFLYKHFLNKSKERPMLIKGTKDATVSLDISRDNILESRVGNEFTYSFWIKVDDWGHNFSQPKHVFHVGDKNGNSVCPGVWLYPKNNNLMVRVDTHERQNNISKTVSGKTCQNWLSQYPHQHKYTPSEYKKEGLGDHNYCRDPENYYKGKGTWCYTTDKNVRWGQCSNQDYKEPASMNPAKNPSEINDKKQCDIVNIPIQRWIHIVVVLANRTVDVYLNGKLSRSCTLGNIPITNKGDIYVNLDGGFSGSISDLLYVNSAISASEIYSLFNAGNSKSVSDDLPNNTNTKAKCSNSKDN